MFSLAFCQVGIYGFISRRSSTFKASTAFCLHLTLPVVLTEPPWCNFFCAVCYVLFSLLYAQSVSNKNQSWTVVKAVRQALIMNDAIGLSSEYNVDKWVFTAKKKSVCTFAVGGG